MDLGKAVGERAVAAHRFAQVLSPQFAECLTARPATASAQAPAPLEGPRVAFTSAAELSRESITASTFALDPPRLRTLVRGSRHGLAPRMTSRVSWSADGERIAFEGWKGKRRGIYTARADGSALRPLRGTRAASDPVFSPDGTKIAFSRLQFGRNSASSTTLWLADADGRHARRLVGFKPGFEFTPSSFSPDGETLAATRKHLDKKTPDALLFDLSAGGGRLIARRASEPAFSPDGTKIALVRHSVVKQPTSIAPGIKLPIIHRDLGVLDLGDGKIRALTRTPYIAESSPSWDPSGERLAFLSFRISKDAFDALFDKLLPFGNSIVQVNADGSCRRKLLHSKDAMLGGPAWQPGPGREAGRIGC